MTIFFLAQDGKDVKEESEKDQSEEAQSEEGGASLAKENKAAIPRIRYHQRSLSVRTQQGEMEEVPDDGGPTQTKIFTEERESMPD